MLCSARQPPTFFFNNKSTGHNLGLLIVISTFPFQICTDNTVSPMKVEFPKVDYYCSKSATLETNQNQSIVLPLLRPPNRQ